MAANCRAEPSEKAAGGANERAASQAASAWHTNGGFSGGETDGFLEITTAANGANLGVLFPLD
jgi:hypothetical protein